MEFLVYLFFSLIGYLDILFHVSWVLFISFHSFFPLCSLFLIHLYSSYFEILVILKLVSGHIFLILFF